LYGTHRCTRRSVSPRDEASRSRKSMNAVVDGFCERRTRTSGSVRYP